MERRDENGVAGGGIEEGSAAGACRVDGGHAISEVGSRQAEGGEYVGVFGGILEWVINRVNETVTEVAGDAAHVGGEHLAAIGGDGAALEPTPGKMAAEA
jgi:hypothetical protein